MAVDKKKHRRSKSHPGKGPGPLNGNQSRGKVQKLPSRRHSNVYSFDEYSSRKKQTNRSAIIRRKKVRHMRVVSLLLCGLFLVYICAYVISSMNKQHLSETKVTMGYIESPLSYTGIIVRDEEVYTAAEGGSVVYYAAEGERIKAGALVCDIQDTQTVQNLETELAKVNQNILEMQKNRSEYSLFSNDIKAADSKIKSIVDSGAYKATVMDAYYVYDLKASIQQQLNARNQILLNENKGSLAGLGQERAEIESRMNQAVHPLYAAKSGVVSYALDGLETILTFDSVSALSKEQTTGKPDEKTASYNNTITQGMPVFKVIKSNRWYIAAYLPTELASDFTVGKERTIYMNRDGRYEPFAAVIYQMTEMPGGESYIVFECTKYLNEYLDERSVSFQIQQGVTEGLKIPNTAIADKTLLKIPNRFVKDIQSNRISNKSQGVTLATEEGNETVTVLVVSADEEYTYILQELVPLRLGDTLVNTEDPGDTFQIAEVKSVKGVYVTTGGVPIFRQIRGDGELASNQEYTIIDAAVNTSIKNQDRIISDVSAMTSTLGINYGKSK